VSRGLPLRAVLALLVLWAIWSYNWIVMKEGLRDAGPFAFGALRGIPGAAVLFVVTLLARRSLRPVAPLGLAALGLFQTFGFVALANLALVHGAVGKTTILVYTFPFWTLLFAWPLLGERIRGLQWLAVGMAATGLTLVIEPWRLGGGLGSKLFAVATGMSWAVSAMVAKWLRARYTLELLPLTAWQMLFGGIALVAASLLVPEPPVQWTGSFAFALAYTILLSTATAWVLWLYVLDHLPAGIAGLSMLAIPVLAVLFSRWRYAEQPGGTEVAGMVLVGASLALLSWLALRPREGTRPLHSARAPAAAKGGGP
jgi:drug/metabolite transporter (DMT)-like permease